jgi:hypothetical protein
VLAKVIRQRRECFALIAFDLRCRPIKQISGTPLAVHAMAGSGSAAFADKIGHVVSVAEPHGAIDSPLAIQFSFQRASSAFSAAMRIRDA